MGPQPPPVAQPSGTAEAGTSTADLPRLLPPLPMMPPLPIYVPPPAPVTVSQLTNLILIIIVILLILAIPKLCRRGPEKAIPGPGSERRSGRLRHKGRPRQPGGPAGPFRTILFVCLGFFNSFFFYSFFVYSFFLNN